MANRARAGHLCPPSPWLAAWARKESIGICVREWLPNSTDPYPDSLKSRLFSGEGALARGYQASQTLVREVGPAGAFLYGPGRIVRQGGGKTRVEPSSVLPPAPRGRPAPESPRANERGSGKVQLDVEVFKWRRVTWPTPGTPSPTGWSWQVWTSPPVKTS